MSEQDKPTTDRPRSTPGTEPWPTLSELGVKAAYAAAGASGIVAEKVRERADEAMADRRERRERRRERLAEAKGFVNDLPNQARHLPGQAGTIAERVSTLVDEWAEKGRADVDSARERWGDRIKGEPAARRAQSEPTGAGVGDEVVDEDDVLVEPDVAEAEPVAEGVEDVDGVVVLDIAEGAPGDEPRPV